MRKSGGLHGGRTIDGSPDRARGASGTTDDVRSLRLVLDAVRLQGARSRADVVAHSGLSRPVVAQRIADLLDRGLLEEPGTEPSTGGRPPRRLSLRGDAGYILAADLGATSIDVAVATLGAELLVHRSEPADIGAGPGVILGRVETLFDELLRGLPDGVGALSGIGIGVPGPVEFRTGRPVAPPIMPGWDRHPIRERFAARYGAPVWVDNDVNVMGVGEWRAGSARGFRDVVFVKIGTGIGAGLISNGLPHRGAQGAAGDVGHIQVVDEGVVCRCGNAGCLEALAGGAAIARDAEAAAREGRSPWLSRRIASDGVLDARTVAEGASHGDAVSVELLQRSGRLVGHMLASVVNLFNPGLIVVGGGVARSGNLLLATIRETVYGRSLPLATTELQIVLSSLGEQAGVIGAAALVADQLFSDEHLADTLAARASFARAG